MQCSQCKTVLASDARFCPQCGKPIPAPDLDYTPTKRLDPAMAVQAIQAAASPVATASASAPAVLPGAMEALLAEANLLRMRGDYTAAEARCIEAIKRDPNDAGAHSLLGDIYRDQDRLDDAVQWYSLALDLNPQSNADRAKLNYVEQEKMRRDRTGTNFAALAPDAPLNANQTTDTPIGTQKLMGASPVLWLRVLTVVGVLFFVGVIIFGVSLKNRRKKEVPDAPSGTVRASAPLPEQGTLGALSAEARGQRGRTPRSGAANGMNGSMPTQTLPTNPSASEQEVSRALTNTGALRISQLAGVALDPGQNAAQIFLNLNPASAVNRDTIVQEAFRAAQALLGIDTRLLNVRVNVRSGQPVFVGTLSRTAMQSAGNAASATQMLAAFSGVWWAVENGGTPPGPAAPPTNGSGGTMPPGPNAPNPSGSTPDSGGTAPRTPGDNPGSDPYLKGGGQGFN